MKDDRRTGRIKKYGVCINDKCEQYKQIQELQHGELVCPACGQKLSPCAPPKKKGGAKKPAIIGAVVVVLGAIVALSITGIKSCSGPAPEVACDTCDTVIVPPCDTCGVDTIKQEPETEVKEPGTEVQKPEGKEPQVKEPKKENPAPVSGRGTVDLGYAKYEGDLKNGKPHGYGVLTYKKSHKIVDSQEYMASPGDTFEGDFRDGRISGLGYWKHNGNSVAIKP